MASVWKQLYDAGYITVTDHKPSYTSKGRAMVRDLTRTRYKKGEITQSEMLKTISKISFPTITTTEPPKKPTIYEILTSGTTQSVRDTLTGNIAGYLGKGNTITDIHGVTIGTYKDGKAILETLISVPKREGIPYCEEKNYKGAQKYLWDLQEEGKVPGGVTLVQTPEGWKYKMPKPENETMKLDSGEWINKQWYDELSKDFPDAQKYLNKHGFENYNKRYIPAQVWMAKEVQEVLAKIEPYKIEHPLAGITQPAFIKYLKDLPIGYDLPTAYDKGVVSTHEIEMLFGKEILAETKKRAELQAIKVPELPTMEELKIRYLTSGGYASFFMKDAPAHKVVAGEGIWLPWVSQSAAIQFQFAKNFKQHIADFEEKWEPFVGKTEDGETIWLGSEAQCDQYTNEVQTLQQQTGNLTLEAGMILAAWQAPGTFFKGLAPGYGTIHNWGDMTKKGQTVSIVSDLLVLVWGIGLAAKLVRFPVVKVQIPKGGTATVWRGLSVGGKPTFGISKSKLTIGTKGITYPAKVVKGYEPGAAKIEMNIMATNRALTKMGFSKAEINRLFKTLEARSKFAGKESPYLDKGAIFQATKTLNTRSIAELMKTLMGMGDRIEQVFGSSTIKTQLLPKLSKVFRKSADIDIQTRMTTEETIAFAKELVKKLQATEGHKNIRISKDHPTLIEIKVKGVWHHAVDIKSLGQSASTESAIAEGAYGMLHAEKVIEIKYPGQGVIKIMRLSESGKRKAQSILRWQDGEFGPYEWRGKDIGDFYAILWTFEGEAAANAWAKVWGYTPSKLMTMIEQNPPKLVGWQWVSDVGKVPKGASPRVKVILPSELGKALKAKSPSVYNSIVKSMPYTSSLPLIASLRSLGISLAGKIPSKLSVNVSRSLPSSPAVSPSIKASPYASPSPSPSGKPSPSPSPSPYPYPYGYPSPYPYPPPPTIPPPIIPPSGIKKIPPVPPKPSEIAKLTKKQREGIMAWKQGIMYRLIYPPYGAKDMINSRKPLAGVKYDSGSGSAYRSVLAKGGVVPREVLRDMGIMDLRFRTTRPTSKKPKLFYKRDIKQKTTTTPGITRIK